MVLTDDERRARQRQYADAWADRQRAAGLCTRCGSDLGPDSARSCADCLARDRARKNAANHANHARTNANRTRQSRTPITSTRTDTDVRTRVRAREA